MTFNKTTFSVIGFLRHKTVLSDIVLNVVMLSVTFFYCYAESRYAESHYT
jgi:hypothetical protein